VHGVVRKIPRLWRLMMYGILYSITGEGDKFICFECWELITELIDGGEVSREYVVKV
jgi:hypothetical protein